MKAETSALLRVPAFRKLLVARTISNFGNGLSPIAIAFGVLSLPGATPKSLSLVMFAQMLPIVAFMLVGGVIADRYPRALLIGSSDMLLSALVVGNGIALATNHATVQTMMIVGLLSGTLNAVWWPAMSGLIPELVEEDQLQPANSFVGLVCNFANIIGTVTGGIIVATIGAGLAIVLDGITFFIAGILVFQLRQFGSHREVQEHSPSVLEDLVDGWREFISLKWVVAVVSGYSIIAMLFESAFAVVGPVFAKESLGGPKPWSWILASLSVGMVVGVLTTVKARPRRPLLIGSLVQMGMVLWFLSMGKTISIPFIMVCAFFCGFAMDFFMVLWQTAIQANVPRESISRVASYDAFGSLFFAPLGLVLAGPIVAKFGSQPTFTAFAAIMAVVVLAMLSSREVRNLPGQQSE